MRQGKNVYKGIDIKHENRETMKQRKKETKENTRLRAIRDKSMRQKRREQT
jgi:hypothetical protein